MLARCHVGKAGKKSGLEAQRLSGLEEVTIFRWRVAVLGGWCGKIPDPYLVPKA